MGSNKINNLFNNLHELARRITDQKDVKDSDYQDPKFRARKVHLENILDVAARSDSFKRDNIFNRQTKDRSVKEVRQEQVTPEFANTQLEKVKNYLLKAIDDFSTSSQNKKRSFFNKLRIGGSKFRVRKLIRESMDFLEGKGIEEKLNNQDILKVYKEVCLSAKDKCTTNDAKFVGDKINKVFSNYLYCKVGCLLNKKVADYNEHFSNLSEALETLEEFKEQGIKIANPSIGNVIFDDFRFNIYNDLVIKAKTSLKEVFLNSVDYDKRSLAIQENKKIITKVLAQMDEIKSSAKFTPANSVRMAKRKHDIKNLISTYEYNLENNVEFFKKSCEKAITQKDRLIEQFYGTCLDIENYHLAKKQDIETNEMENKLAERPPISTRIAHKKPFSKKTTFSLPSFDRAVPARITRAFMRFIRAKKMRNLAIVTSDAIDSFDLYINAYDNSQQYVQKGVDLNVAPYMERQRIQDFLKSDNYQKLLERELWGDLNNNMGLDANKVSRKLNLLDDTKDVKDVKKDLFLLQLTINKMKNVEGLSTDEFLQEHTKIRDTYSATIDELFGKDDQDITTENTNASAVQTFNILANASDDDVVDV